LKQAFILHQIYTNGKAFAELHYPLVKR